MKLINHNEICYQEDSSSGGGSSGNTDTSEQNFASPESIGEAQANVDAAQSNVLNALAAAIGATEVFNEVAAAIELQALVALLAIEVEHNKAINGVTGIIPTKNRAVRDIRTEREAAVKEIGIKRALAISAIERAKPTSSGADNPLFQESHRLASGGKSGRFGPRPE